MTDMLRVYCSRVNRSHEIARVTGDSDGLLLTYRQAVHTPPTDPTAVLSPQDGLYYRRGGAEATQRATSDELLTVEMWCDQCTIPHPAKINALFAAARTTLRGIQLESRGHADGVWNPH